MKINFFVENSMTSSSKKRFGICDKVSEKGDTSEPAYIDENNGTDWIANVDNFHQDKILFYPVDNCVKFPNKTAKRCDGFLVSNTTIAFVELKSRREQGYKWIADGEKQLRASIAFFEQEDRTMYTEKRAYVVNNMRPQSRVGQATRMERFFDETGYVLFIKAEICLYNKLKG